MEGFDVASIVSVLQQNIGCYELAPVWRMAGAIFRVHSVPGMVARIGPDTTSRKTDTRRY